MLLPFLHDRIAVIDLAITGTAATSDGIAEIGILRIALGKLIEEWSSLVNPKMSIPYSFLKLMIEKRLAGTTCFSYS